MGQQFIYNDAYITSDEIAMFHASPCIREGRGKGEGMANKLEAIQR